MVIDVERTVALIVLLVFVAPFSFAVILMYVEDWVEDRIIGTQLFGDLQSRVSKLDHQVKSLHDKCKHMHILIMNQRELIMKQQELLNKSAISTKKSDWHEVSDPKTESDSTDYLNDLSTSSFD